MEASLSTSTAQKQVAILINQVDSDLDYKSIQHTPKWQQQLNLIGSVEQTEYSYYTESDSQAESCNLSVSFGKNRGLQKSLEE